MNIKELMDKEVDKLENCIHCGLCLDHCPTYRISSDENNSPRGRLATWRAISEGRIEHNESTDFYLSECLGCMACESACPANVPYEEILLEVKEQRVTDGIPVNSQVKLVAKMVQNKSLFQFFNAPVRLMRKLNINPSKFLVPGNPPMQSTYAYAKELMEKYKPSGPKVAVLTGCLMDGVYREINFATLRVLVINNIQIIVPESQQCCGAVIEHNGLQGKKDLDLKNQGAFDSLDIDCVISNSAGCGLSLAHGIKTEVKDLMSYLAEIGIKEGAALDDTDHVYIDIPCHLCHGQGIKSFAKEVLDSFKTPWSMAPLADECCGAGGTYNITKEENSRIILERKSAFLNESEHKNITLATSNHICMQQWQSGMKLGIIKKKITVKHLIQLIDESYQLANVYV
ncbi:MAG: (Fe-S)-binding protein [Lentisphaeria bacterium]|nr:(Fe-S)-binding protein [Lentisphaeria bacterium]NQZ67728.1 (Fe-S)-binding protein [Lentisphaeria bacterium]